MAFQAALKRRIRCPVYEKDDRCCACGKIRDKFGDHSILCNHKGDRTRRHNDVRDNIGRAAGEGGMTPELEKVGLLPGRCSADGAPMIAARLPGCDSLRRPADVYIPRGISIHRKGPAALDMAVTSGLQQDKIAKTLRDPEEVLQDYEKHKDTYLDTEAKCTKVGLDFKPVVFEAHSGGWSPTAQDVIKTTAKKQFARGVWCQEGPHQ